MITEQELREAIAECQGQRNPNANTCVKMAAYYTILDHIKEGSMPTHSFATQPKNEKDYSSNTEFGQKIKDMDVSEVLAVMDELMSTLKILNPRIYEGVMSRL